VTTLALMIEIGWRALAAILGSSFLLYAAFRAPDREAEVRVEERRGEDKPKRYTHTLR
jgi:hypothetical protein